MLTSTRTSGCKRCLSTGSVTMLERHGFFALHQIPDTEVGSGHVSGNHRVAVNRQIRERGGEHTAGFFLGSVKLIPCRTCDQRMRFAAVVEITEHIAPHIVSFLEEATGSEPALRLDVREPNEVAQGAIPGAVHIPIGKLRESLELLPKNRRIAVYCHSGKRAHDATRLLRQHGFQAENLSGGYLTYLTLQTTKPARDPLSQGEELAEVGARAPLASCFYSTRQLLQDKMGFTRRSFLVMST